MNNGGIHISVHDVQSRLHCAQYDPTEKLGLDAKGNIVSEDEFNRRGIQHVTPGETFLDCTKNLRQWMEGNGKSILTRSVCRTEVPVTAGLLVDTLYPSDNDSPDPAADHDEGLEWSLESNLESNASLPYRDYSDTKDQRIAFDGGEPERLGEEGVQVEIDETLSQDEQLAGGQRLAPPVPTPRKQFAHGIGQNDHYHDLLADYGVNLKGCLIQQRLGAGAQGEVYLAVDPNRLDKDGKPTWVVIKTEERSLVDYVRSKTQDNVLEPVPDQNNIKLDKDIQACLAKLQETQHPNLTRVYDYEADGNGGITTFMEYYPQSLDSALDKMPGRRLGGAASREVARQLVDCSEELLQMGMVHKDIRPANLLLSQDGQHVVLTDFSLMKDLPADADPDEAPVTLMGPQNIFSPKTSSELSETGKGKARSMHNAEIATSLIQLRIGKSMLDTVLLPFDPDEYGLYDRKVSAEEWRDTKIQDRAQKLSDLHYEGKLIPAIQEMYKDNGVAMGQQEKDFLEKMLTGQIADPRLHPYVNYQR
ncbi:protein kinase domain-containing protein [Parendozoicomonas haliclonae]|uniref:Protein kinase domain protein n=1 Tax=Parendozoicomonas haliclonae TaxID=1960125 RepID=A0A1X7AIC7_9GAMM|nr:protein kinase [Parendozoicomonas haliclonae]SMA38575.1 Protein kinase domain protein [Parendozoicomonas haliclonae]